MFKVFECFDILFYINVLENDLCSFVIKCKIFGGIMSCDGCVVCDIMFGLLKSCRKFNLFFWYYFGDWFGIVGEFVL